jgi:uncharacterized repeat protein (TIGR03803 family)
MIRDCIRKCAWYPAVALIFAYGMVATSSPAQTFTSLVTFDGSNGETPNWGALVQGLDGEFYGVTIDAWGNIFKITRGGTLTIMVGFSPDNRMGCDPWAGLVLAADGNFYGSTLYGGPGNGEESLLYKMTPAGELSTVYTFPFSGPYSQEIWDSMIQANDGNFYGTIKNGGTSGMGAVFKFTPEGTLSLLHSFDNTDGADPTGSLVQATNGSLYGTTFQGGPHGLGTIFEMTTAGVLTPIHAFNNTDGAAPQGGLVQAGDGNFYGTTYSGGANDQGTVFQFTGSGVLTTLYNFAGPDGANPRAGLIQAGDGNFYGTTAGGGADGMGTVFEITPAGLLTTLHSFSGPDGSQPWAALVQGTDGSFYGTTAGGGTQPGSGVDGTVFRLDTGLSPFVRASPAYGSAGAEIRILGTDLSGATAVNFKGVPAGFTIVAPTEIVATIPGTAPSGPVQVTFPSGSLSTIGAFQIMP